jgi:hypothetical protein
MVGSLINDELVRMWKEAFVTYFRVLSRNWPGELRKTAKSLRIVGMMAKIRTRNLSNTNHKRYSLSHPALFVVLISFMCTVQRNASFSANLLILSSCLTIISPTWYSIMYTHVTVLFLTLLTETPRRYCRVLEWLWTGFWTGYWIYWPL